MKHTRRARSTAKQGGSSNAWFKVFNVSKTKNRVGTFPELSRTQGSGTFRKRLKNRVLKFPLKPVGMTFPQNKLHHLAHGLAEETGLYEYKTVAPENMQKTNGSQVWQKLFPR